MPWFPQKPDAARLAVIRELMAWPEGTDFNLLQESAMPRKAQRWYHGLTLPLARKVLLWSSRFGFGSFVHLLLVGVSGNYWDLIGPFPDADWELALRQSGDDAIRERAVFIRDQPGRLAALAGHKPPTQHLDA